MEERSIDSLVAIITVRYMVIEPTFSMCMLLVILISLFIVLQPFNFCMFQENNTKNEQSQASQKADELGNSVAG